MYIVLIAMGAGIYALGIYFFYHFWASVFVWRTQIFRNIFWFKTWCGWGEIVPKLSVYWPFILCAIPILITIRSVWLLLILCWNKTKMMTQIATTLGENCALALPGGWLGPSVSAKHLVKVWHWLNKHLDP